MIRFSIREIALVTVIIALALGWWVDRRAAEIQTKAIEYEAHQRLIDGLQAELQRVANETGSTIRVQSPGIRVTVSPVAKEL